jgi:hypothetical protein
MDMKAIKELLANSDVRTVIEEQIQNAVADKQKELDAALAEAATAKKANEKELFLLKKGIIAKSNLYETKLKEYYEAKFDEAKKKLGKEVFEFINESVKTLTKTIEEDTKLSTPSVKLQEAFANAVRAMAPYMNVNELVSTNQSKIDELTAKLNNVIKQNKVLESKALEADLHTMVVSECAGYPINKIALLYETVVKMSPKSLTEGKEALIAAKAALKEKEDEFKAKTIEESKKASKPTEPTKNTERNRVKVIAESIKSVKEDTSTQLVKAESALDYDVFLG